MTTKTLLTIAGAAALLLAASASTPASAADLGCRTLSTGETACGHAEAGVCSAFGQGEATGLVHWRLTVRTSNWASTKDYESVGATPSFAGGGAAAVCTTSTCTWATLYANDEAVASSNIVCWQV